MRTIIFALFELFVGWKDFWREPYQFGCVINEVDDLVFNELGLNFYFAFSLMAPTFNDFGFLICLT